MNTPIDTIPGRYGFLLEVEDHFDSRDEAHQAIQTHLSQIVDLDGEEAVITGRQPLTNASGRTIGETLWITPEATETIRQQITQ
jgi:hypothetical protein